MRQGSVTSWGLKDHLASDRAISFMPGEQATLKYDYAAYGQPLSNNGATPPSIVNPQNKGYINEGYDAESGLRLSTTQVRRFSMRRTYHFAPCLIN